MSCQTATRSAVIALREERRAMREGCAFLDEKCLLLAAAMLTELRAHDALAREMQPLWARARLTLAAALQRHGVNGLQCQPPLDASGQRLVLRRRPGVLIELEQTGKDAFRGQQLGTVTFRRNASGAVEGLSIKQDRVWDLRFVRQN